MKEKELRKLYQKHKSPLNTYEVRKCIEICYPSKKVPTSYSESETVAIKNVEDIPDECFIKSHFWTLYGRDKDGLAYAIKDFTYKKEAHRVYTYFLSRYMDI